MVLARKNLNVGGVPENATSYDGPIDFIGSVEEIACEIMRRVGNARSRYCTKLGARKRRL